MIQRMPQFQMYLDVQPFDSVIALSNQSYTDVMKTTGQCLTVGLAIIIILKLFLTIISFLFGIEIELSHEMMSPTNIHNLGEVDRITLGLSSQRSQRRDEFITSQLTNHLFQTQGHKGLDLAAINIQRGN